MARRSNLVRVTVGGVVSLLALTVACNVGDGDKGSVSTPDADGETPSAPLPPNSTGATESDAASDTGTETTSAQGALRIVDLSSTVSVLTGGRREATDSETVTFIAIVTDSRGLDAIAGGQLLDDTGATYGAFGAGAQKGTYTVTIGWDDANRIRPLDFGPQNAEREFVAKFFDNGGDVATAKIKLRLACRAGDKSLVDACGGQCVDWRTDPEHCGGCKPCAIGLECKSSACSQPTLDSDGRTSCISVASVLPKTTCNDVCATIGKTCLDPFFEILGKTSYSYMSDACSAVDNSKTSLDCARAVDGLARKFVTFDCICE